MWYMIPFPGSVLQISLSDPGALIDIGTAVFALVLFSISLYAWYIRKQFSLVIVSLAFFTIFARTVIREFLSALPGVDFITDALEFVALALFFVAIVVRPRKDIGKTAI